MALTLGEAISKAIKLIDEYSINGKVISDIKNADYLNKMREIADMAQMELIRFRKIPAVYEIVQTPLTNLISSKPTQQLIYHRDTDLTYSALGALSYYFEIDNIATVLIKVDGVQVAQIDNATKGSFTAYKDFVPGATATTNVSLVFSGPYLYNIKNIALYSSLYPSKEDIPRFSVKRRYTMPDDFMALQKFILEDTSENYITAMDYYWEDPKTLVMDYSYEGTLRIQYFRYPTKITEDTPDDYEFEVAPEVANLIPYYLAWNSKSSEEPQLAGQLRRIYETMLANLEPAPSAGIEVMQDVNNW